MAAMSKPSSLKVFVTIVLSLVILWAGVAVLIGVFALLVKLFGLTSSVDSALAPDGRGERKMCILSDIPAPSAAPVPLRLARRFH